MLSHKCNLLDLVRGEAYSAGDMLYARVKSATLRYGPLIYVVGGMDSSGAWTADCQRFVFRTGAWESVRSL